MRVDDRVDIYVFDRDHLASTRDVASRAFSRFLESAAIDRPGGGRRLARNSRRRDVAFARASDR